MSADKPFPKFFRPSNVQSFDKMDTREQAVIDAFIFIKLHSKYIDAAKNGTSPKKTEIAELVGQLRRYCASDMQQERPVIDWKFPQSLIHMRTAAQIQANYSPRKGTGVNLSDLTELCDHMAPSQRRDPHP